MNNITYSKNSIANPSKREKTDRELLLEAKALLRDVLDSRNPLQTIERIKEFLNT